MQKLSHLLFFSGSDCPHCALMKKLLDRLEQELGIVVQEKEVWGNESNYRLLENYLGHTDCPGIPVLVNTQTGVVLCGEVSYKQLQSWAMGANVVQ